MGFTSIADDEMLVLKEQIITFFEDLIDVYMKFSHHMYYDTKKDGIFKEVVNHMKCVMSERAANIKKKIISNCISDGTNLNIKKDISSHF